MEKTKRTSPRNLAENCFQRCATLQHWHPLALASCCRSSAAWTDQHRYSAVAVRHQRGAPEQVTSQLRSVTCHMGSHSVTFHPTQVNTPRLNPSQTGWYLIFLPRRDGRLSWPIGGWLHTETVYLSGDSHPSKYSNRATALIETNVLTTTPRRHPEIIYNALIGLKLYRRLKKLYRNFLLHFKRKFFSSSFTSSRKSSFKYQKLSYRRETAR